MFKYFIREEGDDSWLWFSCEFLDGENEDQNIVRLTYEVMQGLQIYTWVGDNFKRLINASKINHLTVKEQAQKWLSHANSSMKRQACADIINRIKIENGYCKGSLWLPTEMTHRLDTCKQAVKLDFETNKKDDESTGDSL